MSSENNLDDDEDFTLQIVDMLNFKVARNSTSDHRDYPKIAGYLSEYRYYATELARPQSELNHWKEKASRGEKSLSELKHKLGNCEAANRKLFSRVSQQLTQLTTYKRKTRVKLQNLKVKHKREITEKEELVKDLHNQICEFDITLENNGTQLLKFQNEISAKSILESSLKQENEQLNTLVTEKENQLKIVQSQLHKQYKKAQSINNDPCHTEKDLNAQQSIVQESSDSSTNQVTKDKLKKLEKENKKLNHTIEERKKYFDYVDKKQKRYIISLKNVYTTTLLNKRKENAALESRLTEEESENEKLTAELTQEKIKLQNLIMEWKKLKGLITNFDKLTEEHQVEENCIEKKNVEREKMVDLVHLIRKAVQNLFKDQEKTSRTMEAPTCEEIQQDGLDLLSSNVITDTSCDEDVDVEAEARWSCTAVYNKTEKESFIGGNCVIEPEQQDNFHHVPIASRVTPEEMSLVTESSACVLGI